MNREPISRFIAVVGENNCLLAGDDLTHYTHENRGLIIGRTPLVVKPQTTEEVSKLVKLAVETGTALVPQGGHTGHAGGGVPDESGEQIVVSLERMNRIREIDLDGNVLVCDAGCVLENIQNIADQNGRLFPLSLGSQGSCQIGGNISTNAGGTSVLAYGNTRQLVMGLEVVLPSGEIWNGLRRLKKDNTGYDLKDLFIGAEGTLGIITGAVLKLFPKPKGRSVAFCGMNTPQDAVELFKRCNDAAASALTAFELMAYNPIDFTLRNYPEVRNPLGNIYPWQVLMEVSSTRSQDDAEEIMQSVLEKAFAESVIVDASLASSISQQNEFWNVRETMPIAQKSEGASMKHDISVPVHRFPEFFERAEPAVLAVMPGARVCAFGHLGDGNIHYNISQPVDTSAEEFMSQQPAVNDAVHALVVALDGSVSAEHGIGRLKRDLLAKTKDPIELELMRSLKKTFDPYQIMNPGKVI